MTASNELRVYDLVTKTGVAFSLSFVYSGFTSTDPTPLFEMHVRNPATDALVIDMDGQATFTATTTDITVEVFRGATQMNQTPGDYIYEMRLTHATNANDVHHILSGKFKLLKGDVHV